MAHSEHFILIFNKAKCVDSNSAILQFRPEKLDYYYTILTYNTESITQIKSCMIFSVPLYHM